MTHKCLCMHMGLTCRGPRGSPCTLALNTHQAYVSILCYEKTNPPIATPMCSSYTKAEEVIEVQVE